MKLFTPLFTLFFLFPIYSFGQFSNTESDITTEVYNLQFTNSQSFHASVPYYAQNEIDYRMETGLFFGFSHPGIEASLLQPYIPVYGSFFLGFAGERSSRALVPDTWVSGITIGREYYVRGSLDDVTEERVSLYFRAGPGIGLAGTGSFLGPDANYYFGFNGQLIAGMDVRLSDRTKLYLHVGGRSLWYPALDDIGFFVTPYFSFGVRFLLHGGDPAPVRFR
ncbi:hypothetical protein DYD21_14475 [Rhodohalobacter sp. SW132]|uniref:hypothetical protein n=1 Tax=Rhodohalobacter sp. SW132 TaxID=2293433 RepID=UPI000E282018|nr:hypothetical protein [Rhodohalobacter sp. SW132]REL29066.1 hypothetical protein DYD21_14475 [Rhodohalobacter sp. SW132]